MMLSSPGSPEAAVRHGRAPRGNPATPARRAVRSLLAVVLTAVAGLALAPLAQAHEGTDFEIAAVLDQVSPQMPGVTLTVETTPLGSQFVLENPTETEVTVLSSVGDPLFKVGPGGVLGNFRSPEWYTSKVPNGAITIPERAAERGAPVWARVSSDPAWGWFDHRLHTVALTPEQKEVTAPLAELGSWTVPLMYGETLGSVDGHFEFHPRLGSFVPELSDESPAPGVTLTALQGNPRPGVSIANSGSSEVIVLGELGEPYLRITERGTEANGASPTWIASQNPSAQGTQAGDPTVPPQWVSVNLGSQYSFGLPWAEPEQDLAGLYGIKEPTVVRTWSLALVVDGRPIVVDGTTTMIPLGYAPSAWPFWLLVGGAVLALGVGAAAVVLLVRRRRAAAARRPKPRPTGKKERVGTSA
jgi:hypothetical protein